MRTTINSYNVFDRSFHWTFAKARLLRDLKTLHKDPLAGVSATPEHNDIMSWTGVIFGPDESEWEGGTFMLSLKFSESYPYKPPSVRFVSHMFHPNISVEGDICLDILDAKWNSCYNVSAILISIQSMLCDPNTDKPINVEAGKMFLNSKHEYKKRVWKIVERSWADDRIQYDTVSSLSRRLRKESSFI